MKRRSLIQLALTTGVAPSFLAACAKKEVPLAGTGRYAPGMYLSGNYAPVEVETTATDLEVIGTIPAELSGRFLRNGPNPRGDVDAESYHWFIGDGMVHGVRLNEGRAEWYRNRYTTGPNTNVIGHANRTFAIVESGQPTVELSFELDPMGTQGAWGAYTAHPKYDPMTGELHAISYDWANYRDHVKYTVLDADANLVKSLDIPLPGMPMIHDMSLTENYAVIYDLPVTLSFLALAGGAQFPFRWNNDYEPRVGLMPRNGNPADIIWAPVSQNYSYHPMNAYEDADGRVVIDICRYDRMFDADINGPFGDSTSRLDRWTINPETRKVNEEVVNERSQEFPRCHPELNSQSYRYGYTLASTEKGFGGVYKYDMQTGQTTEHKFGPGRQGAEAFFQPKDDAQSEDDGYLMTFVFDEASGKSEFVIMDALDMSRPALARLMLPVRVPYGFHGNWVPDDILA